MSKYTIYGREDCEFCIKAIRLCTEQGVSFSFINMGREALTKQALSERLQQPVKTVPQVLYNDVYIGGCDALEQHFLA